MENYHFGKRAVIGVMIILIGVAALLGSLDIMDTGNLFSMYWPILLILFGIASLLDRQSGSFFGLVLVVVGVFFQLKNLEILFTHVDLWEILWPVLIIIAGLWFIFPKKKHIYSLDAINNAAIFGGADIVNNSQHFKGGEVTAVFGGLDIDLTGCDIDDGEDVVIDAFAAFGGVTFKVPADWHVEMRGLPILGGWENKKNFPKNGPRPTKTITVKSMIICGGIEVK